MNTPESQKVKFGVFEVDLATGELRKAGIKVKLQDQPFQVLSALLERQGEIVSREDLRQKIWRDDTFIDFDQGLSKAVNKLREALGDSADNPRFVETLARRGYRFIAPVETECGPAMLAGSSYVAGPKQTPPSRRRIWAWLAASGAVLAIILATGLWPIDVPRVVDVVQLTNDGTHKGALVADGNAVGDRQASACTDRGVAGMPRSGAETQRAGAGKWRRATNLSFTSVIDNGGDSGSRYYATAPVP